MEAEFQKLINKFMKIKSRGWIKSVNNLNNGVGLTFEQLLGICRNELEIPDYDGIELKCKRYRSRSYITLFSSKPEGKYYHEVERIKDLYGYPHRKYTQYKVLNNSTYCNIKTKIGGKFYFKLDVNKTEKKIYLVIYDLSNKILEREVYWDFSDLKEKVERKLNMLAIIKAYTKKSKIDNNEYFWYHKMIIYKLKNFDTFLNLIENDIIRVNFKLNIETKGKNIGKIHDHGTSFDILEKDLSKLYNIYN